jgi:acetyltransferase-like isoleucine patch superfamily enzyme
MAFITQLLEIKLMVPDSNSTTAQEYGENSDALTSVVTPAFMAGMVLNVEGPKNALQDDRLIHPSAYVSPLAFISIRAQIHAGTVIGERSTIGEDTLIDRMCYIEHDVIIGSNVHVQNGVSICRGVMIESGVFIGSKVVFTNYRHPRAIYFNGATKPDEENEQDCILVRYGGSVIMPGVRIGIFAMVAPGSVVVHDVPPYGLVMGNPAQLVGFVCHCGKSMHPVTVLNERAVYHCDSCNFSLSNLPLIGA